MDRRAMRDFDDSSTTIPAQESCEEEALLCVQNGEIGIARAREAVQRYRDKHGYDWLSLVREARKS